MDHEINRKIKRYTELVRKKMPVEMIVLYGSYAKGNEQADSDIDIAVVVDEVRGDFIDVNAELFSICREVDTRIEPKLIISKNNRSGFLESILKYGKVLYQA